MIAAIALLAVVQPIVTSSCVSSQTSDLIECAAADSAAADAALDLQWKKARAKATAQDKDMDAGTRPGNGGLTFLQTLLTAQRLWLAYREAQCRFVTYRNFGGRELRIYQESCRARLTLQRIQDLKEFNKGQ